MNILSVFSKIFQHPEVLNFRFCSLYLLSELKFLDNFYGLFREIRSFRKNSEKILFSIFQFISEQYLPLF